MMFCLISESLEKVSVSLHIQSDWERFSKEQQKNILLSWDLLLQPFVSAEMQVRIFLTLYPSAKKCRDWSTGRRASVECWCQ